MPYHQVKRRRRTPPLDACELPTTGPGGFPAEYPKGFPPQQDSSEPVRVCPSCHAEILRIDYRGSVAFGCGSSIEFVADHPRWVFVQDCGVPNG